MNYYDKINWKNRSEGKTTKISAERLNHMDNQIFNNANAIGNVEKIADIGDGTLCGAAETLKETAEKLTQSLGELKTIFAPLNNVPLNSDNRNIDFLVHLTDYRYVVISALIKDTSGNKQRVTQTVPVDLIKTAPNTVFSVDKFLNPNYYACIEFHFPNVHTIEYINAQCLGFASIWIDYIFAFK